MYDELRPCLPSVLEVPAGGLSHRSELPFNISKILLGFQSAWAGIRLDFSAITHHEAQVGSQPVGVWTVVVILNLENKVVGYPHFAFSSGRVMEEVMAAALQYYTEIHGRAAVNAQSMRVAKLDGLMTHCALTPTLSGEGNGS